MKHKIISITEARKEIFKIMEEVQKPNTIYTFTVEGSPQAVLLSKEEYDSIMATMELLSEPDFVKDLIEAEEDYVKGNYSTWDKVKRELNLINEPGFAVCDNKAKYNEKKSNKHFAPKKRKKI